MLATKFGETCFEHLSKDESTEVISEADDDYLLVFSGSPSCSELTLYVFSKCSKALCCYCYCVLTNCQFSLSKFQKMMKEAWSRVNK